MKDKHVYIDIPKSWNELSHLEFSGIASAIYKSQKIDDAKERDYLLYLAVIKEVIRRNSFSEIHTVLKDIPPKEFIPHVKYIFEGIKRTDFIPFVKNNNKTLYAPGPRLNNISIAEFSLADAAYYLWRKTDNKEYLNLLCAILYRPKKWFFQDKSQDQRRRFNKFEAEKRSKSLNISLKLKIAIAFTYEGCRNNIMQTRPNTFPKGDSDEVEKYHGFKKIILAKSGDKFGSFAETSNTLVTDFLDELEEEFIESKS